MTSLKTLKTLLNFASHSGGQFGSFAFPEILINTSPISGFISLFLAFRQFLSRLLGVGLLLADYLLYFSYSVNV